MSTQTGDRDASEQEESLICLTTRSAVENRESRRVNIPKEVLNEYDLADTDDFDVIIRAYSDRRLVIDLPGDILIDSPAGDF